MKKFPSVEISKIVLVRRQIEGWYLSGLDSSDQSDLGISLPDRTENIGKEEFKQKLQSSEYTSMVRFYNELADRFSISAAKRQNKSFAYFASQISL